MVQKQNLQRKITVTFSFPIFSRNLVILEIIKAFFDAVSSYNLRNIGPTKLAESEGYAYIHQHFCFNLIIIVMLIIHSSPILSQRSN